jgi:restriction system protein
MVLASQIPGLAGLGLLVLLAELIAWVGSRRLRARWALRHARLGQVDYMDGTTFEFYAAEILRANGYQVEHVGKVGDFGADLIVSIAGARAVVQTKRYASNVGLDAVREAAAARAHYATDRAIVLTNSYFTESAIALAHSNRVELWDRDILSRLGSHNAADPPATAPALFWTQVAAGFASIGSILLFLAANSGRRRRPWGWPSRRPRW